MRVTKKTFYYSKNFECESGQQLSGLTLSYTCYGKLNDDKSNVIWVVHALTGDSNVHDWWPNMVGPGKPLDTDTYFIICCNCIGSHYGSTSPLDVNPTISQPYYHSFPPITNRDVVRTFQILAQHLGIEKIHTLVGPSLGGQQALEWAILEPSCIERLILVATNAVHSPYGIAYNESQRMAIELDPSWNSAPSEYSGIEGMKVARSIALISYRTSSSYNESQPRNEGPEEIYKAASYQRYQGEKLAKRFNAFSYRLLLNMMDGHDIARDRASVSDALSLIRSKTEIIGIDSDVLFPTSEQELLQRGISNSRLHIVKSNYGHDGFLIENIKVGAIIKNSLMQKCAPLPHPKAQ